MIEIDYKSYNCEFSQNTQGQSPLNNFSITSLDTNYSIISKYWLVFNAIQM